ncbi:MAG: hypothetical protein Kow00121_21560 [Elainellaceae cyanobacterium]
MSIESELVITEFAMKLMIRTKQYASCSVSIGGTFTDNELHQKTGKLDRALEYCNRALQMAIELGIPLVKECEALKQQLEEDYGGDW